MDWVHPYCPVPLIIWLPEKKLKSPAKLKNACAMYGSLYYQFCIFSIDQFRVGSGLVFTRCYITNHSILLRMPSGSYGLELAEPRRPTEIGLSSARRAPWAGELQLSGLFLVRRAGIACATCWLPECLAVACCGLVSPRQVKRGGAWAPATYGSWRRNWEGTQLRGAHKANYSFPFY